MFPAYDLELQQRCLHLVRAHTDVPVPDAPWYEPDPSWLGTPFLVMGRVDGVAATDIPPYPFGGWIFDATPEQRRQIERRLVSVLARLHTLRPGGRADDDSVDLRFLDRPEHGATALDQHLGYQRWYYDWARDGLRVPLVERTFAWLDEHRPDAEFPTVLNWGDARIGNVLWRDHVPVAVLDWEMAALGPPEVDLAWTIHLHEFFHGIAVNYGFPGLPDFLERDRVVATYEELHGLSTPAPPLVRDAGLGALRDHHRTHHDAEHRVRGGATSRRPRRPHHVPSHGRTAAQRLVIPAGPVTRECWYTQASLSTRECWYTSGGVRTARLTPGTRSARSMAGRSRTVRVARRWHSPAMPACDQSQPGATRAARPHRRCLQWPAPRRTAGR